MANTIIQDNTIRIRTLACGRDKLGSNFRQGKFLSGKNFAA